MKFKILRSTSAILFIDLDQERRWTAGLPAEKSYPHWLTPAYTSASSSQSAPQTSDKDTATDQVHKPVAPFPNRFRNNNKNIHMKKILEMFNQVKLNMPLLDAIQQVQAYAKFLKDIW